MVDVVLVPSVLVMLMGALLLACSSGLRPELGLFFGPMSLGPSPGMSVGLSILLGGNVVEEAGGVAGFTAGGGVTGADAAGAAGLTAGGGVVVVVGGLTAGGGVVVVGGTLTTDGGGVVVAGGGVVAPLNCPEEIPLSVSPLATV